MLGQDLRWAFTPPFGWLAGIGVNFLLSLLYVVWVPLTGDDHADWAILVGTYYAVFVLADVTTTNVLGVDTERTGLRLLRGVPLGEVLLVKNLALLLIVGLPMLVATGAITYAEPQHRLALTLPGVLYPMLTWLGVGNLVSVLLPYTPLPLALRWRQRRSAGRTAYWLFCLFLPYALCLAVDQMKRLPRLVTHVFALPSGDVIRGAQLVVLGVLAWAVGTFAAVAAARLRTIGSDDIGLSR